MVFESATIYLESEYSYPGYMVLYGKVYLKLKEMGIFKECRMGDSFGEYCIL